MVPGVPYPGGPYLVTASGLTGDVLIWDEARGLVIDRLRLPAVPGSYGAVFLQQMTISEARVMRIEGLAGDRARLDMLLAVTFEVNLDRRAVRLLGATPREGTVLMRRICAGAMQSM